MEKFKLGEMEQKFAELIWANAPISMRDLITLCSDAFDWKRTTTYTMLKRLCDRELFVNDNGIIKIILSKEDFLTEKGEEFLEETFDGSLPQFIAAFWIGYNSSVWKGAIIYVIAMIASLLMSTLRRSIFPKSMSTNNTDTHPLDRHRVI